MINRNHLTGFFEIQNFPMFICPRCGQGALQRSSSDKGLEPEFSSRVHSEEWHEWTMVQLRLGGLLKCSSEACGEYVSFLAIGSVEDAIDYQGRQVGYDTYFKLGSIFPSPDIIDVPEAVSENVKEALRASFNSFWVDFGLSTNALRRALENLLDDLGAPREKKPGKRLNMSQRIETLEEIDKDSHDFADAMRSLLNHGSHQVLKDPVPLLDTLEAFELFLEEKYGGKAKRLADLKAKLKGIEG